jgi:hypothetical protein
VWRELQELLILRSDRILNFLFFWFLMDHLLDLMSPFIIVVVTSCHTPSEGLFISKTSGNMDEDVAVVVVAKVLSFV